MFRKLLAPIVLLACVSLLLSYGYIKAETSSASYGFDVSINPDSAKQGVFQAKLVVSEISSGKIVAAPTVRFRAGQPAETTLADSKSGRNFKFVVSINEKGTVAEYSAVVLDSTSEVSRSQAKISLIN